MYPPAKIQEPQYLQFHGLVDELVKGSLFLMWPYLKRQDRSATPCHGQEEKMEAYQRLAERSPYMRCLLKAVPWICWVDGFCGNKLLLPIVKEDVQSTMTPGNGCVFLNCGAANPRWFRTLMRSWKPGQTEVPRWWSLPPCLARPDCSQSLRHLRPSSPCESWRIARATSWPMWAGWQWPIAILNPEMSWLAGITAFPHAWRFRHAEGMPHLNDPEYI